VVSMLTQKTYTKEAAYAASYKYLWWVM